MRSWTWLRVGILFAAFLAPAGPAPARLSGPVKMDLVVLPTLPQCLTLPLSVLNLKQKYGEEISVVLHVGIVKSNGRDWTSPRGSDDFNEARRWLAIREHSPDRLWAFLNARCSDSGPVWENAARWAGLDPGAVREWAGHLTDEDFQKESDFLKASRIRAYPTLLFNGERIWEGKLGLPQWDVLLQSRLKKIKSEFVFPLVVDPASPQPKSAEALTAIMRITANASLEMRSLTPETESELQAAGISALPVLVGTADFMHSSYAGYVAKEGIKTLKMGWVLPVPLEPDTLLGREREPGVFQVVMMSHCPFAGSLMSQLVAAKRRGKLTSVMKMPLFMVNPLTADKKNNGVRAPRSETIQTLFSSQHGREELEEDNRQLALQKYYPEKYWDYVLELYSTKFENWEASLQKAGIDPHELEIIQANAGVSLMRENQEAVAGLPVYSSPTLIVENRYLVQDMPAYFKDLNIVLSGSCGH